MLIAFLGNSLSPRAQVKFYTAVSQDRVNPGQTFQLQYVIRGNAEIRQVTAPDLPGFRVLEIFESKSTTIDPQNLKPVDEYSKILVLSARRPGKYVIDGATAVINGKTQRSNGVRLQVVTAGAHTQPAPESNRSVAIEETSELRPGESIDDKISRNFFLKVEVNRKQCYVGECLMATYKAYSRLNASSQVVKRPSFTGFSVLEMVDAYDSKPDVELVNGVPFYVNLIRKVQLFPLQPGTFMLDPAEVESVIHFMKVGEVKSNGRTTNISRIPYNYHLNLKTEPVPIQVDELPRENQPGHFAGAIGQFAIQSRVLGKDAHKGDLLKVQLEIKGTGNFPLLTAPRVDWPRGVDTADPEVHESVNRYVFPLHGSKLFEYAFVAPDTGMVLIPQVKFPYYDPVKHDYRIAITDSIQLHIAPAVHKALPPGSGQAAGNRFPKQYYWFALVVLAILSWIGYQFILLRRSKPPQQSPPPVAPARVADPLTPVRLALMKGETTVFYEVLQSALWQSLSSRLQLSPTAMNKTGLQEAMNQHKLDPAVQQRIAKLLNECEWALYVPGYVPADREVLLREAQEIVRVIS